MAKATASPPARRRSGDRPRGKAKTPKHKTKETSPPKHGARARGREAARQDRAAHGGAGFFSAEVRKMSAPDRGEMLDRADKALSIRRQCALLCVARSGVYRAKRPDFQLGITCPWSS